jgi:catechol 2,3-dioxygenase-like lactoylglutathione lyase family enzyme
MLDHTGIVVSDLPKARKFYEAVAKALGLGIGTLRPSYWVEGSRAGINQMHVAFAAKDNATVDEFYRATLAVGGRDNGKPGPPEAGYYGAFVLNPDGNNIEAVARG